MNPATVGNPYANGTNSGGSGITTILLYVVIVAVGLVAIYFLYGLLNTATYVEKVMVISGKKSMPDQIPILPQIPTPHEGGDYTFSTWIYVNSLSKNMNKRKHVFEIEGKQFSTLLVGLGAYKNSLIVRTHSADPVVAGFQNMAVTKNVMKSMESFVDSGNTTSTTTERPNSTLTRTATDLMFTSAAPAETDDILSTPAICDMPELDMQKWILLTVVLSGRTIDVYLDGKLARSCLTGSYFKVDPTGVKATVGNHGGFDGYISNMFVTNNAMTPDEIYRTYLSGPEASPVGVFSWITSFFSGKSV